MKKTVFKLVVPLENVFSSFELRYFLFSLPQQLNLPWPLSSDIRYFVITVFLINVSCLLPAFHESSLKSSQRNAFDGKREGEIAALLSNHLLSCLVYGNKYLISNTYQKQPSQCPCLNPIQCMEHIPYGETGLGK